MVILLGRAPSKFWNLLMLLEVFHLQFINQNMFAYEKFFLLQQNNLNKTKYDRQGTRIFNKTNFVSHVHFLNFSFEKKNIITQSYFQSQLFKTAGFSSKVG